MSHEEKDRVPEGVEPGSDHEDSLSSGRLRRQAEAFLKGQTPDLEGLTAKGLEDLVHELQVHQVELELQNQALRETQQALALARDEYADLYDRAPVGYVTVDGDGTITRANATAADLLLVKSNALVGKPFRRFVARGDQDAYHFFLMRLSGSSLVTGELNLVRGDGSRFRARLEGVRSGVDREDRPRWRAAVSDVTAEHEAREALRLVVEGTAPVVGHDFLRALVHHLARLLDARYVIVGEFDDTRSRVRTHAVWAGDGWIENWTIDLRGSAFAPAAAGQASFYASGLRGLFPGDPFVARWRVESARALPLRDVSGQVRGMLLMMDEAVMAEAPHLEPILAIFAERAAAELARLAAETSLQRFSDEQAALYAVAAALAASLEPAELANRVLDVIVPLFGAAAAWIVAAGEERDDPPGAMASRGFEQLGVEPCPLAAELEAWRAGTDPLQPPGAVRPDRVPGGLLERANMSGHVCLPLASQHRIVGWLHLAWHGERALKNEEECLLLAIGDQVALGLYNAHLYQQARQVDRLRGLAELDLALMTSLDPNEVAAIGLQRMAAALRAPEALMLSYSSVLNRNGDRVLTLDEGWIRPEVSARYHHWRDILETLSREGRELRPGPPPVHTAIAPWGSGLLVVPLDDDEPLADLILSGRAFAEEDVALARAVAGRVSQALRNARLYAEVRDLLRRQQETHAQLVHSEKMAALGRLTASLSHEINNPLQAVLGFLGLMHEALAEKGEEEAVSRYLLVATQALNHVRVLMDRMRGVYRPSDGDLVVGDVQVLLEGLVELVHSEFQHRHVTIARIHDPDLPAVRLNPGQMHQVFLNLILNAADAMPDGGNLILRTGRGELARLRHEPQPAVCIHVQDTGVGIAPAVQQRLFEPFFTTRKDGSGLGLYISQQIVQAHDGKIEVHSREGEGTTVTVWLPVGPLPGEEGREERA